MIDCVLRVYWRKEGVDITFKSLLFIVLLIGHINGQLIRLPSSCLFMRVNDASRNLHKAVCVYEKNWDGWNSWFVSRWCDLWKASRDSSRVTRSLRVSSLKRTSEGSLLGRVKICSLSSRHAEITTFRKTTWRGPSTRWIGRLGGLRQDYFLVIRRCQVRLVGIFHYAYVITVVIKPCANEFSHGAVERYVIPGCDLEVLELSRLLETPDFDCWSDRTSWF